jgi:hypothetical protein
MNIKYRKSLAGCEQHPTASHSQQNRKTLPASKFFPFITGVFDTGDQRLLMNISANFHKNSKWLQWDT